MTPCSNCGATGLNRFHLHQRGDLVTPEKTRWYQIECGDCGLRSGEYTSSAEAIAAFQMPAASAIAYREAILPYSAAFRMIREGIETIFGPLADLESEEAVLLRGPEPTHDAEAFIAAFQRILPHARKDERAKVLAEVRDWANACLTDSGITPGGFFMALDKLKAWE